jgi:translation initiation factor 1
MPPADAAKAAPGMEDVVIRIQQRAGRKSITTIQGLYSELDFERLAKEFRKRWGCSSIVVENDNGTVIQLQGDQREHLRQFLLAEQLVWPEQLKILGT